ncbi:MAG: phosphoribosyltransferase [Patescibacteria group bacterium]
MPIKTNIHNQLYEKYSFDELGGLVFNLAEKIIAKNREYDRLVAPAKGGLTFARSLVDLLKIPDVSSIKIEFYTDIATTNATPIITQSLPVNIKGERVLIYDDLIDSGETLELASKYLKQAGAKSVDTAVIFRKTWTKKDSNFFVAESDSWIIFPNETRETITLLENSWKEKGDNPKKIRQQLLEIGFKQEELALFAAPE